MAYITADTVKSAVGIQLKANFPDTTWYKEDVTNPKYPNFFVYLITSSIERVDRKRYMADFMISIKYRQASDPTTVSGLNGILDNIGLQLCDIMDKINVDGKYANGHNVRFEKVDGICQFIVNYAFMVTKEHAEQIKMNILKENNVTLV